MKLEALLRILSDDFCESSTLDQLRDISNHHELVEKAYLVMSFVHQEQVRSDGSPYALHPIAVAFDVADIFAVSDPEILAAALLHDTVEDGPERIAQLFSVPYQGRNDALSIMGNVFGSRVASIVGHLTNPDFDDLVLQHPEHDGTQVSATRLKRFLYRQHVLTLFDEAHDAAMIKFCDFSQNALSLHQLDEGPKKKHLRVKYKSVVEGMIRRLEGGPWPEHPLYAKRDRLLGRLHTAYKRDYHGR